MKRTLIALYLALLIWCTAIILWRRWELGLIPTQVSTAVVYVTVLLNASVVAALFRKLIQPR